MKDTAEGRVMKDKIETIGQSVVQHGKINNRIYLIKLAPQDTSSIVSKLDSLAIEKGYTKVFAKIHANALPFFILNGYFTEAFIPKFYENQTDCLFVSKFIDSKRNQVPVEELKYFYELLNNSSPNKEQRYSHSLKYELNKLGENDAAEIAEVFKRVFETYPFPVHDPDYLVKTMQENGTRYFGVRDGDNLIGVSTAEIDIENKNAEMTDFAVLPEYRGQKLAIRLLLHMEVEMKIDNIKTVYTIARLKEPGMNKTFLNAGYQYTGTLINNTNISGNIESMNVLFKHL